MSYLPGDTFYYLFDTNNLSGVSTNADFTPAGVLNRNGVDDFNVKVFVTNIDLGRYVASGVIPSTYAGGNTVELTISGSVNNLYPIKANFNLGVLDRSLPLSGTPNVNVVSFSGSPVAAANNGGAILSDSRYLLGQPASLSDGLVRSATINSVQLSATEPNVDNYYQWCYINTVGLSGAFEFALITSYSGASQTAYIDKNWLITPQSGDQYNFIGYARTNPIYMNNQLLGSKAGINFNTFFQNAGGTTVEVVDNVGTGGSGGSGITDWTSTERSQIRYLLGIDGAASIPATAKPAITVSVTGMAPTNWLQPGTTVSVTGITQVNVVSMNPGLTISVTGTVMTVMNVVNPVGVTGVIQTNVVTVSGVPVAAPDGSGFILTDLRAINGSFLGTKAGTNFNIFFGNAGNTTTQVVDNIGTGGGSSGITDWTSTERGQIRYLLGIDGSASVPSVAKPAITVSVTGVAQSNVVSINPGLTVSVTGTVTNVSNIINPVSVTGTVQANVITISGGLVAAPDSAGFILSDLRSANNTTLGSKAGSNFNVFFQNAGNNTTEIVDNVGTASGTGGTDWTTNERSQIRYKLGIDGTTLAPTTPYAGNLELSLSGLHNIMVENGVNMNQWMEAVGAVIAGSSTVNGNTISYYAMNNNGVTRVTSTAVSGARNVVVLLL